MAGELNIEVSDNDGIYMDGKLVAEITGGDDAANEKFRKLILGLPGLVAGLKLQRKCCCEALDDIWDPSGEGKEAFNDMVECIDKSLRGAGVDPDPCEG